MNKQFADFVRVTGEYNVPFTSFCTNGQLLTEKVVEACIDAEDFRNHFLDRRRDRRDL